MRLVKAFSTAAVLSSGTGSSAVPGPVSTPVAVMTSVLPSASATVRSTATLTRSWKSAAVGVPVKISPSPLEIPDSVVPPVASLLSRCGALDQQVLDAHELADMRRVDDDPALGHAHRERGIRADQPGRIASDRSSAASPPATPCRSPGAPRRWPGSRFRGSDVRAPG